MFLFSQLKGVQTSHAGEIGLLQPSPQPTKRWIKSVPTLFREMFIPKDPTATLKDDGSRNYHLRRQGHFGPRGWEPAFGVEKMRCLLRS